MEWLSNASNVIIIIGATVVAIANIYRFFTKGGKNIKKKVTEVKNAQECAEETRVRNIISQVQEEQAPVNRQLILSIMQEALPDALDGHYKKIREKFKGDREKYLHDITDEVISNIQSSLETVETHETRMVVFTEVLKELLRERIMAIYSRNMHRRELEEHEKIELERSYASYKSINGNSYIDEYYERMQTWKIIPDEYHKKDTTY